jgi:hypothetical protein
MTFATSIGENAGGRMRIRRRHSGQNVGLGRIGLDLVEHRDGDACRRQRGQRRIDQAGLAQALVGDQQHARAENRTGDPGDAGGCARTRDDGARGVEGEHARPRFSAMRLKTSPTRRKRQ